MSDAMQVLDQVQQADARAAEELLPLVYEALRILAPRQGLVFGLDLSQAGRKALAAFPKST